MSLKALSNFEKSYGWLIRWAILLICSGAFLYADALFVSDVELKAREAVVMSVRMDDLARIDSSIKRVETDSRERYSRLEVGSQQSMEMFMDLNKKVERLIAQNEMILKVLEHQ